MSFYTLENFMFMGATMFEIAGKIRPTLLVLGKDSTQNLDLVKIG